MPLPALALAAAIAATHLHPPTDAPSAAPDSAFARCLRELRARPAARSISAATWRTHVAPLAPDPRVLASLDAQPEFVLPPWDYLAVMVDHERVVEGLEGWATHRDALARMEQRYGVDPAVVVAVWGIESNYGKGTGGLSVLRSLATLSCEGRRQRYFRGEFLAALRIVQGGHIAPDRFRGSWAGAFGQTQFMPSTFERLAVDFDGDGRRDLMDSAPDALASAANYLRGAGWRRGEPWGFEVRLPARGARPFDASGESRGVKRSLATWQARGLVRADGTPLVRAPLDTGTAAGLLLPAGVGGPAFLVLRNFDAVYRYNASERYALAILHLADRLRGGAPFATPWPTDDPGLSRAERRELQRLLIVRGHDIGTVDGTLGPRTRAAVQAEQRRLGHPDSGRPGQRLLAALRER